MTPLLHGLPPIIDDGARVGGGGGGCSAATQVSDPGSYTVPEPIPAATRNFHLNNATSDATFTRTLGNMPSASLAARR
jgi:hypothetical protein